MRTLTCIPAFNEEHVIEKIVKEALRYSTNVVVCDDGSLDNTSEIAEKAGAYVITHKKNLGKGAALKSLFTYARHFDADVIVTIDGDGQFLTEEIPKLIKPIVENNYDVVIGYRFDDDEEMPTYRKLGNKLLDRASNSVSELPFRDTQSGFRAYSNKAINTINFNHVGFVADSEILIDASQKGLKISEEKVTVLYDTGTKTSTKHPISHAGSVFASLVEMILIKHPLKYLGLPGILGILLGLIFSSISFSIFNDTRILPISYTILSLIFLTLGTMLVLVSGILFSINRTIHHR